MRKASLILSSIPLGVVALFLILASRSDAWDGLTYLVVMLFSAPFLLISAIISVVLAFKKTESTRHDRAAKVMSLISTAIFGLGSVFLAVSYIITQNAYYG